MATFVLVHGSSSGGWSWRKVTPCLCEAGHEVYTLTLTGLGERVHLLTPEVNLTTHIRDVVNVLFYEDLHDVVLVGQSYGGMVVTGVAEQAAERIRRLVYLDAFIPHDGESAFDIVPSIREDWSKHVEEINGVRVKVPWGRDFLTSAWGITDPGDLAWMEQRDTPMPLATCEEPIHLSENHAAGLPRGFIRCTQSALVQLAERAQEQGLDYHELPTGHVSMVTAPRELASLLIQITADSTRDQ